MKLKNNNDKLSNFYTRTITALILFPPVLYAVISGGFLYFVLLFIAILLAGYEWSDICGKCSFGTDSMAFITGIMLAMTAFYMNYILLGLGLIVLFSYITYLIAKMRMSSGITNIIPSFLNRPKWMFLGSIYLGFAFSSLAYLTKADPYGYTIIWVFLATIFSDIGAYIIGSLVGGKKIAPKISPGKSWSGLFGAIIVVAIVSYLFSLAINVNNGVFIMCMGGLIVIFAHVGDMLESAFKRYLNIKDTSQLIPGHGGVLDRLDAMFMVAIFITIITLLLGKSPLFFTTF